MAMIEAAGQVVILKRAAANRSSGDWNDDNYDVLADGVVVGRIFRPRPHLWEHRGCGPCSLITAGGYACDARGCHGGIRQKLAAGVTTALAAALLPNCRPKSCNAAKG